MSNANGEHVMFEQLRKHRLLTWLKTTRLQTGLVTSLALWVGYTSVSALDVKSVLILGFAGLAFHIFGFTLNEVKDAEYDASIGNGSVHPIARGEIPRDSAHKLAWAAYFISIFISLLSPYSINGTLVLALSVIPAYLYDEYSKTHWWSNIYLSVWASMMVISGALHAGTPNIITGVLVLAVGIQIFVQVMQGDLKDLTGDEASVCRTLGVTLMSGNEYVNKRMPAGLNDGEYGMHDSGVVTYTKKFIALVYSLKTIEIGLLFYVVYTYMDLSSIYSVPYLALYFITFVSFVTSLSMFMVWVYDRDYIKKYSSMHELSAILFIGLTVFSIDTRSGVVIALAPVIWYILMNKLLHSGALNPDV